MPRFVVLLHEMPAGTLRPTHYDLMFEQSGVLWTWAVENLPTAGESQRADRLPDHRVAYLEYEGELTGGRGHVRRIDAGQYELLTQSPAEIVLQVHGQQLVGILTLALLTDEPYRWRVALSGG